jgi:hypothetical protein
MMTLEHERWDEFADLLAGPDGCNFRGEVENLTWRCDRSLEKPLARRILNRMGLSEDEIDASCDYFEEHGGFCDCEIVLNIAADALDRPRRTSRPRPDGRARTRRRGARGARRRRGR